jgi:DMSO reductase family type II enzyme chaperone
MNVLEDADLAELTEARRAVYRFLQAALEKPSRQQHEWLTGDAFREGLARLCELFNVACPGGEPFPADPADHESRYLACFEVGLPTPPVVLLASYHSRHEPAPRIIHEHVLFYKWFGILLPPGDPDPADHLLHELAFLVWLDDQLSAGRFDAASLLGARRDFLARHVARWVGKAVRQAEENGLPDVYQTLLALLDAAVRQDLELTATAGDGCEEGSQ